jgi:hypothetical protein
MSDEPLTTDTGVVFLFKLDSTGEPVVVRDSIGTIDYKKGEIKINAVQIVATSKTKFGDSVVEVSSLSQSNDIIGLQDLYLQLDTSSSSIQMVSDTIESGIDLSGSQYISSSSYLNGQYIRL